jgi:hypothetical protein
MNMNDSGPYEYNDAMAIANAFRAANVSNILPKVMCVCVVCLMSHVIPSVVVMDWTGLDWRWTGAGLALDWRWTGFE